MSGESTRKPVGTRDIIEESGRIVAILVFWGLLAVIARYGVGNVGISRPGQPLYEIGRNLATLFTATGMASVLLFVVARGIQLAGE